jgi:hypothetical protein
VLSQPFEVLNDPRSNASIRDLREQNSVQLNLLQCVQASWDAYEAVVTMRSTLADSLGSSTKEVADAAKAFDAKLASLAGKVTYSRGFGIGNSSASFVALNGILLQILNASDTGDSAPTDANWSSYANGYNQTQMLLDRWRELNLKPLTELNTIILKSGLKPISAGKCPGNPPSER